MDAVVGLGDLCIGGSCVRCGFGIDVLGEGLEYFVYAVVVSCCVTECIGEDGVGRSVFFDPWC